MCGRYTLAADLDDLIEVFEVPPPAFEHRPRYNVAPTQDVPVVAVDRKGRRMGLMRWGLVPYWARDPAIGNRQINARGETVHTRPAFRDAFRRHRCLVPADGFFEWARLPGRKQPFWVHDPSGGVLAFAGVWDRWRPDDGDPIYSFAILTTDASDEVRRIHPRMPVILPRGDWDRWLDRDTDPDAARALIRPYREALTLTEVSTWVNAPANDDPTCIEPVS